jgi:peptidoglycan DL-endopeptidase CwlO
VAGRLEPVSCLIGNDDSTRMGLHTVEHPGPWASEAPETTLLTQTGPDTNSTVFTNTSGNPTPADAAPTTRRARREAEAAAAAANNRRALVRTAKAAVPATASTQPASTQRTAAQPTAPVARVSQPTTGQTAVVSRAGTAALARSAAPKAQPTKPKQTFKRRVLPVAVVALTAGILGTNIMPALANQSPASTVHTTGLTNTVKNQSLTVSDAAAIADTTRDGYTATSTQALAAQKQVAAVQAERASTAASYASYTGPTAADYVANPKYPSFSLDQVVSVAKQYIGTPYVFGGATPAGFDCSGYVMFVYAQFGINLAHSVPLQDAAGTTIPESEAVPGDVVIFDNEAHDGFYMGNGMIMDAPKPGGKISIRPIWDQPYHIVRFGIK